MPAFCYCLASEHRPEEEYTLIYVLNELNLGQNRDEENSLVFKAMRRAWRCQGHEHITQSVVDHHPESHYGSSYCRPSRRYQIALRHQRFEGAVDFAESILHMIRAIFAQLGLLQAMQGRRFGDSIQRP